MIYGTGIDIAKVSRFEKWVKDESIIKRFFNPVEIILNENSELTERKVSSLSQHYAARFAAKEAFSKALGTGISGFELKDVYIENEESGKPCLKLSGKAKEIFEQRCGNAYIHVSLSHEKEYAVASVIIEK